MELRLRDYLAKLFNGQHPSKDVRKNPRAMAKLLKEANRLKTVLSANADHMAQVRPSVTGFPALLGVRVGWGKGGHAGTLSLCSVSAWGASLLEFQGWWWHWWFCSNCAHLVPLVIK